VHPRRAHAEDRIDAPLDAVHEDEVDTAEKLTYRIVGEDEADIKSGRISVTAPVARAMIGKSVGDTVKVKAPRGIREIEIVDVKFEPGE
jgi:transcription elongation factor GreA